MTSPDQAGIPAESQGQQVGDWGSAFPLLLEGLAQFFGDIPVIGDIAEALTGVEDGDYSDLGTFASLLLGRDVSLAGRVSRIENKIAIGAQYFDDFNRGDNDAVLGEGWTQGGNGQVLGIHDQAAQLKRDALPADGVRYAICPQVASADTVTVSAVIHPKGTPPAPRTSLFLRANAALTEFVYVNLFGGKCYLGRGTRSGNSWSFTDWKSDLTKSYSNSSTVEFKAAGTHYQLVIDGVLILDHVDVSGYPVDAAHRTVAFSLQTWTAILAVPQFSGGLASFALRSAVELEAVAVAQSTAAAAQSTANAASSTADDAATTANNAATVAITAQQTADIAYANAQYQKDGFSVSTAGLNLGYNEEDLGILMTTPAGFIRKITRLIYTAKANSGTITIDLVRRTAAGADSVVWTTNVSSGEVMFPDNAIDYQTADLDQYRCNVTAKTGNVSVLHCWIESVLLEAP